MAIPDFQTFLLPLLKLAEDGNERSLAIAREHLATQFTLSSEERTELLPSGRQRRFDNRVAWAKVYLEQAGLLSSPRRGHFKITPDGLGLLAEQPRRIDIALLERFDKFREFRSAAKRNATDGLPSTPVTEHPAATPEEQLEQAYLSIKSELASEVLLRVKASSPSFFEHLVVELLLKMGYGRNRAEAGRAIGGAGDDGIDGIISEDRLGLETIYIQAKRWEGHRRAS